MPVAENSSFLQEKGMKLNQKITQSDVSNTQPWSGSATKLNTDFLTMLVTQIKHQDPLDPMDNNQMTAQLAQLSELSLIENINQSMEQLVEEKTQNSLTDMAAVIDRLVAVPLNPEERIELAVSDHSEPEQFTVNILTADPFEGVAVNVLNQNGEQVKRSYFESDEQGQLQFSIADLQDKAWPFGEYYLDINSQSGEFVQAVEARVKGVTVPDFGQEVYLNLAGMTQAELGRIKAIGR